MLFTCDFDEAAFDLYGLTDIYPTLSHPPKQEGMVALGQFMDSLSADATIIVNTTLNVPAQLVRMALCSRRGLTANLIKQYLVKGGKMSKGRAEEAEAEVREKVREKL